MQRIRIGTRDSNLAIWQAQHVQQLLEKEHIATEIITVKSDGDIDLSTPLYAMGVQGVFTRNLDLALLSGRIDIAVHSMKDVPVQLPISIVQAAVLKRASHKDIFIYNPTFLSKKYSVSVEKLKEELLKILKSETVTIGTSSIRRKAQWLAQYPHHRIENLRGNVNTRLQKVAASEWAGAIFAAAGLERINVRPAYSVDLDWMLPAPAQGAIMVVAREGDADVLHKCNLLNDINTEMTTRIERDFLSSLMGGCSTPISAYCRVTDNILYFEGSITSPDGKQTITVNEQFSLYQKDIAGTNAANLIIAQGGKELLQKTSNE